MPVYDFWVTVNSLEIGGARVGVKILSCGDPGGFVAAGEVSYYYVVQF